MRHKKTKIGICGVLIFVGIVCLIFFIRYNMENIFPLKYQNYVCRYSVENEIDPLLVFAIIKVESNFNPDAESSKGAKGLMQVMDGTGIWANQTLQINDFNVSKLYLPKDNIRVGVWYLGWLKKTYNNDLNLMLAAYNAGNGNVDKWLMDKNLSDDGKKIDTIPFNETNDYVKKVVFVYGIYKRLYNDEI